MGGVEFQICREILAGPLGIQLQEYRFRIDALRRHEMPCDLFGTDAFNLLISLDSCALSSVCVKPAPG